MCVTIKATDAVQGKSMHKIFYVLFCVHIKYIIHTSRYCHLSDLTLQPPTKKKKQTSLRFLLKPIKWCAFLSPASHFFPHKLPDVVVGTVWTQLLGSHAFFFNRWTISQTRLSYTLILAHSYIHTCLSGTQISHTHKRTFFYSLFKWYYM